MSGQERNPGVPDELALRPAAAGVPEGGGALPEAPAGAGPAPEPVPRGGKRGRRERSGRGAAPFPGPEGAYVLNLTLTLLGISAAAALLLGVVYYVTKPVIDRRTAEKTAAAMALVLEAEEYPLVEGLTLPEGVTALHEAVAEGETVGYVCEVTSNGFGGAMNLVVGVDLSGRVTGVSVIKHSETKNIGTKVVMSERVLSQFTGLSGPVTLKGGENRFDGVTGATFSSKGVTAAVNLALEAAGAALS